MPNKRVLQGILKDQYNINKNITQSLSAEECEELLTLLQNQPSVIKLAESFITKNEELSQNNRNYGTQRSHAQRKLNSLQAKHEKLEKEIANLEQSNKLRGERKEQLSREQQELEKNLSELSAENQALTSKIQTLTTQNDELTDANEELKKDNKNLKNIVDQIRLRLARDTKSLLEYEDSEIRKALIRLFRWTLG